jgi:ornithine carbamoyltransferase
MKHFLKETDIPAEDLDKLFSRAARLKQQRGRVGLDVLHGQSWGLIFFKKSTRTRVSFHVGVAELGGTSITLNADDLQISRGETIADTARVLSRYLHGLIIRCFDHSLLEEFAAAGTIPVINALSDFLHPCQLYTDVFTLAERWSEGGDLLGSLAGRKVVFFGDTACNVANSWILGAHHFGLEIVLAGPPGFEPGPEITALAKKLGARYTFTSDPYEAARGADALYTDVWVSMGKEAEESGRIAQLKPYAVTRRLLDAAKPGAYFMHCLPAHPGLEVTQEVLDDPRSIIFDQAENRLHVQKAILEHIVTKK